MMAKMGTAYVIIAFHGDGSGVPEVMAACYSHTRAEQLMDILARAGTERELRLQACYLDMESNDEPREVPEHPRGSDLQARPDDQRASDRR